MNIETSRLLLVPVSEAHVKDVFEHFNQDIITYMAPAVLKDIEETTDVIHKFVDQRKNNTDYIYTITLKTEGEFIGIAGLHHLKDKIPELGIWTKLASHGNHYGREAIGGLLGYAKKLGIQKLCYPVDRRNVASKKIPLFYGGICATAYLEVETPDGRILEEEIYEISI